MDLKQRNLENKAFFDEKAKDGYDDVHQAFIHTKNLLTDSMEDEPKNVLDLGAGTGLELFYFFQKYPNAHVKAIDLSDEMLSILREREFSPKVETVCGDFFSIDFGNNFDCVISTSALHHFLYSDKKVLYQKIYDCLRDGGLFLNSDYIVLTEEEEKQCIDNYEHSVNRHNDTPLTIDHELEILYAVGFSSVEVFPCEKENYQLLKARK